MSTPMEMIIEKQSAAGGSSSEISHETLTDSGFYWRELDGVKVLVNRPLEAAGFKNGFSTRLGGVSPFPSGDLNLAGFDEDSTENIMENRRRFLSVFDGDFKLATVWQVHGSDIHIIRSREDAAKGDERADALASDLSNILVGVKTADCVPVLLGDPKSGAYAAVHAGWRGTTQAIVRKTVFKMAYVFGSRPEEMICVLGPAASCKTYEIGQEVIDAFAENFADSDKYFKPTSDGHALVDLHQANKDQLTTAGVPEENIYTSPFCTILHTDLFFSYRIEKTLYGKTGRLLSVIGRA